VRTTLSLDDDVAHLLEKETRRTGASFKEVVNRALRLGLIAAARPARKPFTVKPRRIGLPHGLTYDNVEDLIERLEGANHS
jgi:Ribbon-helix-helix protein, copG family